ncbi:hypothetical protein SAMN05216480_1054 [Pustulibacterium marinum]|uniref:HTH cro/C1-type domain-containing protein n=1 Tax=Pustulibacterium marinum TaxID=1224947 RepID=A0A1I7GJK0_9FLAO|nr:hypothetical protein [Pustulibacterium marinum]SFU48624.1 hypothetical protein SAMN05216480_1054 [Pustulibacterium marinum]
MSKENFKRIAKEFFDDKGLKNKDVANKFGVTQGVFSRYMSSDKLPQAFIDKIKLHYPDLYSMYLNYEASKTIAEEYSNNDSPINPAALAMKVDSIIMELYELKRQLSQM